MQKVTSKDGTQIAFDKVGKGPALILVGGAFQYRSLDPRTTQFASLLGTHFTTYHYTAGEEVRVVTHRHTQSHVKLKTFDALIKDAGGSACVFGMSSGGVLALHAVARGLNITKLALYEPPFNSGDNNARQAAESYTKQLTILLSEGRRSDAVELAMTSWGAPASAIAGMKQTPVWSMCEAIAPTLAYDDAIIGDGAVPTRLIASLTIPLLVVHGGASPLSCVMPHKQLLLQPPRRNIAP